MEGVKEINENNTQMNETYSNDRKQKPKHVRSIVDEGDTYFSQKIVNHNPIFTEEQTELGENQLESQHEASQCLEQQEENQEVVQEEQSNVQQEQQDPIEGENKETASVDDTQTEREEEQDQREQDQKQMQKQAEHSEKPVLKIKEIKYGMSVLINTGNFENIRTHIEVTAEVANEVTDCNRLMDYIGLLREEVLKAGRNEYREVKMKRLKQSQKG